MTLEALAAATAPGQAAVKLRQQLAEAAAINRATRGGSSRGRGRGGRGGRDGRGGGGAAGGGLWEQLLALEAAAAAEVLGKAQVVAATCVGAGKTTAGGRGRAGFGHGWGQHWELPSLGLGEQQRGWGCKQPLQF